MDNKQLFENITEHLLKDIKPAKYLNKLISEKKLQKTPLNFLVDLKDINQSSIHHPEGNVLNHTLLVLDQASSFKNKSKSPKVLMWAALLHDIGKLTTTKIIKGRITSYNHDYEGEKLSKNVLNQLTNDKEFTDNVSYLVKYHMHPFYINKNLPFSDIQGLIKKVDIDELSLLSLSDRLGRGGIDKSDEDEIYKFIEDFKNNILIKNK